MAERGRVIYILDGGAIIYLLSEKEMVSLWRRTRNVRRSCRGTMRRAGSEANSAFGSNGEIKNRMFSLLVRAICLLSNLAGGS